MTMATMDPEQREARIRALADALLRACMYLDGFLWVTEPEVSELEDIKATVADALGCDDWEHAMALARLHEARSD